MTRFPRTLLLALLLAAAPVHAVGLNDTGEGNVEAQQLAATLPGRATKPSFTSAPSQEAYIKASNTAAGDAFGYSTALSSDGNTLAVGAPGANGTVGAVYVYARTNGAWSQQAYLQPPDTIVGLWAGFSVALSADGNTLAVGAPRPGDEVGGTVYIYERSGTTWSIATAFRKDDFYFDMYSTGFGWSVALSGDGSTLAVGAPLEQYYGDSIVPVPGLYLAPGHQFGGVYVLQRTGATWSGAYWSTGATAGATLAYVKYPNPGPVYEPRFGWSVALSRDGGTLAVGATGLAPTCYCNGEVFVYTGSGNVWTYQAMLVSSDSTEGIDFGWSVALNDDGNALATGAPHGPGAGAASVFSRTNGSWSPQAYLSASNAGASDGFGLSVTLSADGNALAAGAIGEDSALTGITAGSPNEAATGNGAPDSGAVYAFTRANGNWSQQFYVKASNTGSVDAFGVAVALSADGDTLAVGAHQEGSALTGVTAGSPDETATGNGASFSGAAYVISTLGGDTTPDAFVFNDQTGVTLSTVITSTPVQISGIGAPTYWNVTAGVGTACVGTNTASCGCANGAFATSGTISNGQYLCARHTSSGSFSSAVDTIVTVGTVSDTFTSTTSAADTTPGGFTFIDQTNVALSTLITSAPVQITGINASTGWTASGGTACVSSANGCACDVATYAASGTILNNQYMCALHTSSGSFSTAVDTTVTVGGVSDTFTSTTLAADTTPGGFTFIDQTNVPLSTLITSAPVQITGINTSTGWTASGGTACVSSGNTCSCDVATYAASGSILNNQYLCARHTSSANYGTATNTLVTVGGVSDTFTSTTVPPPTLPPGPQVGLTVNGGTGDEITTPNPVAVTYQLRGCQNQEMFLVLNAPPMGIVWSFLNAAGQWVPLPANLADITPFSPNGPADGSYPLFTGNVPLGDYELYLGCDFAKNGHLDYLLGAVNGVYGHSIVHVR